MHKTFRAEFVRCGKRCGGCPHGPYWYSYWREGGKLHKKYEGVGDPRVKEELHKTEAEKPGMSRGPASSGPAPHVPPPPPPRWARWDAIFNSRTASPGLAREILGLTGREDWKQVTAIWRAACRRLHPDNGGALREMQFINAAYGYLRWYYKQR